MTENPVAQSAVADVRMKLRCGCVCELRADKPWQMTVVEACGGCYHRPGDVLEMVA